MKIVLVGYMGSGKSTIGRLLAERLNLKFTDLDEYIEQSEGMKIPQLFGDKGEIYFRKREAEAISEVLEEDVSIVLALGGGTPCYGNNMSDVLSFTDNVVYLKVSVMGLVHRLGKDKIIRPLIKNIKYDDLPEFIGKHLFERSAFYQQAKITIDCDGKEVDKVVSEIKEQLV